MDVLSHGLWGGIAFGRKNKRDFWTAFTIGIAPDILSFGIFIGANILGLGNPTDWNGPPDQNLVPQYVHSLYSITHSLLVFVIVFLLVWLFRKKPFLPLFAWLIHILMDIPTHSTEFFPTPFLWPFLDNVRVDGIPWSHPWIFVPNIIFLAALYVWFFVRSAIARRTVS